MRGDKVGRFLQTRSEAEARSIWRLCGTEQWSYEGAMKALASGEWQDRIHPVLYRPFDMRSTVYDPNVAVHRRERVSWHMLAGENIALVTARTNKSPDQDHFFCSRAPNRGQDRGVYDSVVHSAAIPVSIAARSDERPLRAGRAPRQLRAEVRR